MINIKKKLVEFQIKKYTSPIFSMRSLKTMYSVFSTVTIDSKRFPLFLGSFLGTIVMDSKNK
ncbi:UNVERIFIED_CONTAM: hypothetical protein NCL1_30658 [Trichonephila clavipes]